MGNVFKCELLAIRMTTLGKRAVKCPSGKSGTAVPQGMGLPVSPSIFPETFYGENWMMIPVKCLSVVRLQAAIFVQVPDTNNSSATPEKFWSSPVNCWESQATLVPMGEDHSPLPQQVCCSERTVSFIMPGLLSLIYTLNLVFSNIRGQWHMKP